MTDPTLIAFALKPEIPADGDGSFTGACYYVGDGDFHVLDELHEGDGFIVLPDTDSQLAAILDACPVLERVTPPATPAKIVSRWDRMTTDDLAHVASIRDLTVADAAHIAGDQPAVRDALIAAHKAADVADLASAPEPVPSPAPPTDPLALTDAERTEIVEGVADGALKDDALFAEWVDASTVDEIVKAVGSDRVLAKRVLMFETTDGRKGIVEPITRLLTTTTGS